MNVTKIGIDFFTICSCVVAPKSSAIYFTSICRLKARKFQLVAKMTQEEEADPASLLLKTLEYPPPAFIADEKQPPSLFFKCMSSQEVITTSSMHQRTTPSAPRGYVRDDESFDEIVENVRKRLRGNDLPSIEAVLLEVWNREMASGVPEAPTSLTSPVNWCLFFGE